MGSGVAVLFVQLCIISADALGGFSLRRTGLQEIERVSAVVRESELLPRLQGNQLFSLRGSQGVLDVSVYTTSTADSGSSPLPLYGSIDSLGDELAVKLLRLQWPFKGSRKDKSGA